ncbi:hypothetical protein [Chitinophaga sp. OAE865]|uniref:hypothetical protein n=1 Tax=Chitinophaga sp. OAE865 TaxID=2817898 RepID=UPI001AE901CA
MKYCLLFLAAIAVSGSSFAQLSDPAVNRMLQQVGGSLTFLQRQYNGTSLVTAHVFRSGELPGGWQLALKASPVKDRSDAIDVAATFRLTAGRATAAAVAVKFDFSNWSAANYVLVPASLYNGNRYRSIGNGYNPAYPHDMYYNPQVPLTISNNPRLSVVQNEASLVELQTGNMATPAVCFFSPAEQTGFILLTEQQTKWGNSGVTMTENARKDHFSFDISAPAVRKLAAGFGDFHQSGDHAPDWEAGDEVTLRFRLYVFKAEGIPGLLTKFMEVRKDLSTAVASRNLVPMSRLLELGTAICSSNFTQQPAGSYYKPENSNDFQLGWVSGMINTYPMLALNDGKENKRVGEELDFVVHRLQGKSGFFYGSISANGEIRGEKMSPDFPEIQTMVRKNGDALFWLMKHLFLLRESGRAAMISKDWEDAAVKLANAFQNTWEKYGQFGQYIAPGTGNIAVFNSTAGAIAPAGLVLAARYFKKTSWLKTAVAAADYYYLRDVAGQGLTGGGCGDISQDADAESAFGLLESLMALYNYTGDRKWLLKAEVEAALCATWTMSYAPVFPASSTIGKLQSNMTGAVWASIQNKHAAPGICTSSGDYLFKLFRATGKSIYADLIRDIQHAHTEAVNMPGHITTNYLEGSSMERIQPSDAEGKESIGNYIHTRNSWTETNGMLMALELPGVYVLTDQATCYVFDHIKASIIRKEAKGLVMELYNPTPYDASVTIMPETSAEAKRPVGYTAFLHWPKVTVKAGEKRRISVTGKTVTPQISPKLPRI